MSAELAVRVIFKADGSGLVGQARASRAAVDELKAAAIGAGAGTAQLGAGAQAAAAGAEALATEAAQASASVDRLGQSAGAAQADVLSLATVEQKLEAILQATIAATRSSAVANDQLGDELVTVSAAAKVAAAAQENAAAATNRHTTASKANTASAAQQRAAYTQLGFQVQDITSTLALGINPLVVLAQQGGQTAAAIAQMGGRGAATAAFFAGPWGSVILAATVVLVPFVQKLFDAGEATEQAKVGADGLAQAQSALGGIFDLTSGKLERQNELLRLNARLTAINLRGEAVAAKASAAKTFGNVGELEPVSYAAAFFARTSQTPGERLRQAGLLAKGQSDLLAGVRSGTISREDALRQAQTLPDAGLKVDKTAFSQAIIDEAAAEAKTRIADLIDQSLDSNKLADGLKRDGRTKTPKKPKSTAAVEEFGRDALDKIAGITDGFTDQPGQIAKVNKALRELDDLVEDLARRKPPGFEKLIADAERAKVVVREGINQPFNDFIQAQSESLGIQQLITAGKIDEAEALRVTLALEQKMGPLGPARRDAVLATVEALRAEQREQDILREKQEKYLDAIGDVKAAIRGAISGGLDGIEALPGRLIKAFEDFKAREIFDKLFGPAFRELEDRARGTSVVKDASGRMAEAIDRTINPLDRLASAAERAAAGVTSAASGSLGDAAGSFIANNPDLFPTAPGDIVVTGEKRPQTATELFSDITKKLAKGVGISDEAATKIGKYGGRAIEGAATGAFTNSFLAPLGKALGFKTSKTGAQVGGAIGGATGLPGGDIAGSIIGSIVGGLFKKTKSGAVNITSTSESGTVTGNSAAAKKAAVGLAGSVQDAISQIADQLGGSVGAFNVTVGQRHGDYRVTTGTSLKKKKGALDFDDDADAAREAAVRIAITQGAVTGLSAAVQQAIRSSDDIEKALAEALNVQAVEDLIGGIGTTMQKTFKAVETTAAERVRIATKYGLDLVKLEEVNAKERADAYDQIIGSRLSSITDLLGDLSFGDLAEGSAADRRTKLLDQVGKAQTDAEAGVDGAADKLADLTRQLLSVSKEGFGTAGPEYAGDRTAAESGLQRVVQLETERVKAAQAEAQKLTSAVEKGNTLADEANGTLARLSTDISAIRDALAAGGGGVLAGLNVARDTSL